MGKKKKKTRRRELVAFGVERERDLRLETTILYANYGGASGS